MMRRMMRLGLLILSLSVLLPGCARDDSKMAEKLDQMIKKQDQILALLEKGGGPAARGAGAQRPQRARPTPTEVYAVPVDGAPSAGPKDAKVTIVEAFEFACPHCATVRTTM